MGQVQAPGKLPRAPAPTATGGLGAVVALGVHLRGMTGVRREGVMGWATQHIARLQRGETVQFRPRGHSLRGKVDSTSSE
jgi:hypothetical protein